MLEIVEKIINQTRAVNIPQICDVSQVDRHFLELIPAVEEKSYTQKKWLVCTKNKVRKESRSLIVSST